MANNKNFKEKSEISFHLIRAWQFIKSKNSWVDHVEIAKGAGISERTARGYTIYLVAAGLIDQMEIHPRHQYRYSEMGTKRNKAFSERLQKACDIYNEKYADK